MIWKCFIKSSFLKLDVIIVGRLLENLILTNSISISFFQSVTSSEPVSGNELPMKGDGNCGPRAVCAQLVAKTERGTYAELNALFKGLLEEEDIDHITGKEEDQCQMLLRIIASQALRDQIDTLKTGKNPISWRIIIGLKAELNRRGSLPKLPGGPDENKIARILKRIKKQKDLKKAKGVLPALQTHPILKMQRHVVQPAATLGDRHVEVGHGGLDRQRAERVGEELEASRHRTHDRATSQFVS